MVSHDSTQAVQTTTGEKTMSQDLRDYELYRVDKNDREAKTMSVTATVGPSGHGEIDEMRGVQITLETPNGYGYARISEPQIRDLIQVLQARLNPDSPFEATGWQADRLRIKPDGSIAQLDGIDEVEGRLQG